jgi:hypothetical protein
MSIDFHTWASSWIKFVVRGRVNITDEDGTLGIVISSVDNKIWLPVVDSWDGWAKTGFDIVETEGNLPWKK